MPRRLVSKALLLAAVLSPAALAPAARAQQGKTAAPTVILTGRSTNEILGDLRYLASAVGKPDDPQVQQVIAGLDSLKNPDALQGLDPSKPFGVSITIPEDAGGMPSGVIFIPVTNGKKLLDAMAGVGATVEADNSPGFTHKVTLPNVPAPLYVTQGGGYLYLTPIPAAADALKGMNPASLLPKRPGAGDLSLTIRLDRIPAVYKDQILAQMEQSVANESQKKDGESDTDFQARVAGAKMAAAAVTAFIRDGKEVALDILIEPKNEFIGVELNTSAVPGSEFGKALRTLSSMKSRFSGSTADAAMAGYATFPVSQQIRDLALKGFDDSFKKSLAESKDEAAKKIAEEAGPALRDILSAPTVDAAFGIQGPKDSTYAVFMAMAVKGGKRFDKILRDAVKSVPEDKKKEFALDAAKAADGTPVHKFANSEGGDPGPLGASTIYLAFRDDVAAVGAGKNGEAALNTALTANQAAAATAANAPQMQLLLSASRAGDLSKEEKEREQMRAAAKEVFGGTTAKKDKVTMIVRGQGEAVTMRIGMDVPALKFFVRLNEIQKGNQ